MDLQKVFRGISKKLHTDFEISAQINHNGNIGDYRESALREFLENGRLPKRYGIGNGEIVGHISNVSKQSDLILFDHLNNIPLLFDSKVQVYPIDCVYGVVEIKSQLSKAKLIEALENIKSVKEMAPKDTITKEVMFLKHTVVRPKPFGFIFAYSLGGNSLDSLVANLKEWELTTDPECWPNLIVVLGQGIIFHRKKGSFENIIGSESLTKDCYPSGLHHKDDSFFYFYSYLLDLCNSIELPKVKLSKFLDLPQKIGKYIVGNNNRMVKYGADGKVDQNKVYRLTEAFIDKVVKWCKNTGSITNKEVLLKQFGQIPQGSSESFLNQKVYLYNPKNLLGMHEVEKPFSTNDKGQAVAKNELLIPCGFVTVDDEVYFYPYSSLTQDDSEPIEGRTVSDL